MKLSKIAIATTLITSFAFSQVVWMPEAPKRMKWKEAIQYCKDQGGKLPSKKVFQDLWYKNNKASDIKGFNLSVSYWTSDEVKNNKHAAYPFYFMEGRDTWYYKADKYGVRCIK